VPVVALLAAGVLTLFLFLVPARVARHWMDRGRWIAYAVALLAAGAIWGWLTPPMVWSDVLRVPSPIEKLTIAATLGVLAMLCVWGQPKLIAQFSPIEMERPIEALVARWRRGAKPRPAEQPDAREDDPPVRPATGSGSPGEAGPP
jgi:hypothetical protein